MTRSQWLARVGFTTLLALVFWITNALLVGRRLAEPGMIPAFFWNMLLFAVVVTSINAAAVAWTRHRLRVGDEAPAPAPALATSSIMAAATAALAGLGCGIGVTAAVISPGMDSHLWGLFGQGLGLVIPLGIVFSLIGAVVGDLGANLRSMLAEKSTPKVAPGLIVLLVASHVLWAGVAWLMLVSARGHMPGA